MIGPIGWPGAATVNGMTEIEGLIEFLRAQLREDERIALAAPSGPWVWEGAPEGKSLVRHLISHTARWRPENPVVGQEVPAQGYPTVVLRSAAQGSNPFLSIAEGAADHIATFSPDRVLAEVKAKRAILDLHAPSGPDFSGRITCTHCSGLCHSSSGSECDDPDSPWPCETVGLLAQSYAGREGWRDEWSVS